MTTNLCHLTFMVDHSQTMVLSLSNHGRPLLETGDQPWCNHGWPWSIHGLLVFLATFPKQISGKFKARRVAYANIDVTMVTQS